MKINPIPDKMNSQIETLQRKAYLKSKGISPDAPMQMDLIFPAIVDRGDLRHIPNDYARSSLFTARNRREGRKSLMHETLYHYNEHISIRFTGTELRAEDDEIVWLQILSYGKGVPFGEPFEFSLKDLVRDVNWSKNRDSYDRARECISRLKATEVLVWNRKAFGTSGAISLILQYTATNSANGNPIYYRMVLDRGLMVLLAGNTFTSHRWMVYRDLSPVARRLADYIESHKYPYPLSIEKFRNMCASSDSSRTSWRQTVRKACEEVRLAKIATVAFLDDKDLICCHSEHQDSKAG